MATPIRIKVGCSLASGWDRPFDKIEKRSKRAGQRVGQNLQVNAGKRANDTWVQQHVAAEKRATKATQTEAQKRLAEIRKEAKAREREHQQLLKEVAAEERRAAREAARAERKRTKDAERAERERTRTAKREARKRQAELERFARRTSHRTTRFMMPNAPVASMMRRGALDLAHGAGVETNLGSVFGRVVSSDQMARDLSTQAYREGDEGAAGSRVDPGLLREEARALGEEMSLATEEILRGQKAFVDLLGNLEGARALSPELAKLARSQAASFEDTMRAAGKIDSALASQAEYANDTEKRNRVTLELMKGIVYQGKVGSITMDKMAKEIPKLSGIANIFTGPTGRNIAELTAVAQLAERGPAKNAATASTYTQNFALDLTKRADAFRDVAGINVFSDDGKIRGLRSILTETLAATEQTRKVKVRGKGTVELNQLQQLQAIMPNKRSFLAMQEFLAVFKGAGGGEAGIKAVNAEFDKFARRTSDTQIGGDLAVALDSTGAKAQRFNQQLEKVVATMADDLIPAAEELAPKVLELVKSFGALISWMSRNPGLAISAAIGASIARAGIESTLRASIERVIMGSMGTGGTTGAGGAKLTGKGQPFLAGGAVGIAGAAMTITAASVTLYATGRLGIDWLANMADDAKSKRIATGASVEADISTAKRLKREGTALPQEVRSRMEQNLSDLRKRVGEAESRGTAWGPLHPYTFAANWAGGWNNTVALGKGVMGLDGGKTFQEVAQGREDVQKLDELKQQMAQLETALRSELRVRVSNMPDGGGIDQSGRDSQ